MALPLSKLRFSITVYNCIYRSLIFHVSSSSLSLHLSSSTLRFSISISLFSRSWEMMGSERVMECSLGRMMLVPKFT